MFVELENVWVSIFIIILQHNFFGHLKNRKNSQQLFNVNRNTVKPPQCGHHCEHLKVSKTYRFFFIFKGMAQKKNGHPIARIFSNTKLCHHKHSMLFFWVFACHDGKIENGELSNNSINNYSMKFTILYYIWSVYGHHTR